MARSDYSDTERAGTRRELRDALFTFMDAHEPDSSTMEQPEFLDLVEEVLVRTERQVWRRFGYTQAL